MSLYVAFVFVFCVGMWAGAWITERVGGAVDREFPPPAARCVETFPSTTAPNLPREALPPIPPALLAGERTTGGTDSEPMAAPSQVTTNAAGDNSPDTHPKEN